ncbi:MAG: sulfocyanin-like copper-binding protein [Thermoplasmata archaeon]
MSRGGTRKAAVAFAIAVILVGGGFAALVSTAPARAASAIQNGSSGTVSVTAESGFAFNPNGVGNVPTNASITVTFTDNDAVDHTFTIIGVQGWVIPSGIAGSAFDKLVWGKSPSALFNANATASGTSGDQVIASFTSPAKSGWYEFVCTEAGHFQNGMYGFIAFGIPVPGNLTVSTASTDPGIAVFIIVGTIVGLVVIALVLGFVVGRRRGSTYEMPPQRLGYPEPETEEAPAAETSAPDPNSAERRG